MTERKGPSDSATIHPVGKELIGNDGKQWKVIATKTGVHRWSRVSGGCVPCVLAGTALVLGGGRRKGPSEGACHYPVGTVRKGNDGQMWRVSPPDKRNLNRWVRVTSTTPKKPTTTMTKTKKKPTTTMAKTKKKPTTAGATTPKVRKGPTESATKFDVGTVQKGNDGKEWRIVETKTGVKRWQRKGELKLSARAKKGIPNPKWEGGHYVGWC
jgi:hypothetical protein